MQDLTPKQQRVLDFIAGRIQDRGIPPTIREIAKHFSVFPRAIQDHLAALKRKGVLQRTKEHTRGLIVAARKDVGDKIRLPILGRVPAGLPVEAISNVEDYISVDEAIAKRANFVLKVKGDSMSPEIREGDMVLVQSAQTAENGEIVVACVDDGDATVKKLRKTGREVYLEAINPAYSPIRGKPITVVGKVTSLIRPYFKM